ncbi:alpha/beta hydrolase [Nocardioides sp. URHA0020]|uniref:alpha/beta hydrolase n=1 Tax=Nocardioides sp. URHA0020 TaxID=1380392 RepID=UPI0006840EF5|nr:alpha/beta hydrolase [Nocardioides sp. URHA0020]
MTDTSAHLAATTRRPGAATAVIGTALNATGRVAPALAGRLALELWRRPGGPADVRRDERTVHDAARRSRVGADGEVAAYAWGDGSRPVLLVHGWGARASRFADLVTGLLAAGLSPVAYDGWGHGDTPGSARTILEHRRVIAELEQLHGPFGGVVGHSFGVPVALYAVRDGLAADRVVTISGMSDFGYLVETFCARLGLRPPLDDELRHAIERAFFAGDTGIWERFSAQPMPGCEALVVHDAGDTVVDPVQAERLVSALGATARRVETGGLGHGRILRDPTVIATTVTFLGSGRA